MGRKWIGLVGELVVCVGERGAVDTVCRLLGRGLAPRLVGKDEGEDWVAFGRVEFGLIELIDEADEDCLTGDGYISLS